MKNKLLRTGSLTLILFLLSWGVYGCDAKTNAPAEASNKKTSQTQASQETSSITNTTEPATTTQPPEPPKVVKFMGIGDNLIHPPLYYCADYKKGEFNDGEYDFSYLFECISEDIAEADIRFINAETISGGDELGVSGYPSFNSPTQLIYDTANAGFNLIALANNHSLDKGPRGVIHAKYRWEQTDAITSGINVDKKDRGSHRIFTINDIRFGFISYTSHTNGIPPDQPWRVNYMKEEDILRDLPPLREEVDFLIVSAHWGWDDIFRIDDFQRHHANLFAQMGADLVVGTGPHVLQKMEWIEHEDHKTLVAFSIGNYASGMHGAFNALGGVLKLDFVMDNKGRYIENINFVPTIMHLSADDTKHNVYKLSDYTEEMAMEHYVRSIDGRFGLEYFKQILLDEGFSE